MPIALSSLLAGCGSTPAAATSTNASATANLPAQPMPLSPVNGSVATTDTPTLSVQNANGFDVGQANYTFEILSKSGKLTIATVTVAAGTGTTSVTLAAPLPRSATLTWRATARSATGQSESALSSFDTVAVTCLSGRNPYAKSVVDWFMPACSLAQNHYLDPNQVLGPPDAGGFSPDSYFGFISLGDEGYVTVDMEACAVDGPGPDVRVFQTVSGEPVTLYAAGSPTGPFILLEARLGCGNEINGLFSHYCDFDLADGELKEARYFKIEDGEHYPCPGDTVTEGADIDAIQILHPKP